MFFGTTPAPVRDFLARELRNFKPKRVFEPCAGNFVLSMLCGAVDREIEVVSGDVSLYSMAIGGAFTGSDFGIRLKPELELEYEQFAGKVDPIEIAALVVIFQELAKCRDKSHIKYYSNLERDIRCNQERYLASMVEKLTKAKSLLGPSYNFHARDCMEAIQYAKPGDLVFFDPPYYEGDYEKGFASMESCFEYPQVEYTNMTMDKKIEALKDMTSRGVHAYFRHEEEIEIPGFELCYAFEYKADKRYLVYTNHREAIAQGRAVLMREKPKRYDVIWYEDEIKPTSDIRLVSMKADESNHYRLMWTKKAAMKDVGHRWGLVIDGKLAGMVSIVAGVMYGSPYAVIIADAAPFHTRYKRLGKLVLNCILSEEFLLSVNDLFMHEHTGFTTVAYTNAPVSMKYRGLFELAERKNGSPSGHKHTLVYRCGEMPHKTIKDGLLSWLKKHGKDTKEVGSIYGTGE